MIAEIEAAAGLLTGELGTLAGGERT